METSLLIFRIDERLYAVRLSSVRKVIPAIDIVDLPHAPDTVLGVINVGGHIIPVFDLRKRFHATQRELDPNDHLILATTAKREVALVIDSVLDVVKFDSQKITDAALIYPRLEYVTGVVKFENGLALIHDLDTFLSIPEEERLVQAMEPLQTA